MIVARGHRFSFVAHAVDADGALCGARPSGRWRPTTRLPVNCPLCLRRLDRPRYAICETPTAGSTSRPHLRQVGPEGLSYGGNPSGSKTLCGLIVGWDIREIPIPLRGTLREHRYVCDNCQRIGIAPYARSR